jgi:ATP-binding cassette, subfamily B, bacterial MsbA
MDICKSVESATFDERDSGRLDASQLSSLAFQFLRYLKPFWGTFLIGCICSLFHAASSAVQPYFLKLLIDDVLRKNDLARLKVILALILVSAVIKGVFMYSQGYFIAWAGQSAVKSIRNEVYGHMQMLPLSFFEKWKTGQIMYRIITDIHQMTETLTSSIPVAIADFFVFLFSVGAMIYMDWRMTIVAFVASPAIAYIMHFFGSLIQQHIAKLQQEVSNLNSLMQENINGIKVVKAFGAEKRERVRFEKINEKSFMSVMKSIQFKLTQTPLVEMLGTLGIIIIIGLGAYLVSIRQFTTGDLIAFCAFMLIATSPVNRFSTTYTDLRKGLVSASRVFELMDFPREIEDKEGALDLEGVRGQVDFQDVAFSYDGKSPVLNGVSLSVPAGQVVAIVGPNGSGKSTLVNLIPRFYELTAGQILIDNVDIRNIMVQSLRKQIGIVQQETFLFSGTIRDNILFGDPGASLERMLKASRDAGAHEFIMGLPEGYDFPIGEKGLNLSGGQRQRICLARTLLRDPRILILDESTSSMDQKSEVSVYEALGRESRGRTTFIIAHRLSTITKSDKIVVLNNGIILESGTHETLMATRGLYRALFDAQRDHENEFVPISRVE